MVRTSQSDRGLWNKSERTIEVSRELGSPCGFLVEFRNRPGEQSKSASGCDLADREFAPNEVSPSEGKRSEAKRTVGSQSALIVLLKSANSTPEESSEGSEASEF